MTERVLRVANAVSCVLLGMVGVTVAAVTQYNFSLLVMAAYFAGAAVIRRYAENKS
ncbi:MAG: hypothetical protein IKD06_01050 [Clostridia bacterium]|nr:hypothetical protein [Clostridia bacterium]